MTPRAPRLPPDLQKLLNAELASGERVVYAAHPNWRAQWPQHLILLAFGLGWLSSGANALFAVSIDAACESARRAWLIAGVGCNLGLLGYFKYFSFVVCSWVALLNPFGLAATGLMASIVLPIAM